MNGDYSRGMLLVHRPCAFLVEMLSLSCERARCGTHPKGDDYALQGGADPPRDAGGGASRQVCRSAGGGGTVIADAQPAGGEASTRFNRTRP